MLVRRRGSQGLALAAAAVLALSACAASGPAEVESGQYRLLATSNPSGGVPADVSLIVDGDALTLVSGADKAHYTLGDAGEEFTLCPPSGSGTARPLDAPLTLGRLQLAQPAVFGDCGTTAPMRITVVDLASVDEANRFPFARWAEFCDTVDPSCP
jgi:hypothetical protein